LEKKTKFMAWFAEGVASKEIANRMNRDASTVKRTIQTIKDIPMFANPELPKKHSGRPRLINHKLDERLHHYLLRFLVNTAKELKVNVSGWENVSVQMIPKVCKVRLGLPSRCLTKSLC
jgi:predicted transcriptional regulator